MKLFYSLTDAQKAIWNVENFIPNTSINNITASLRFKEEVDFKLLEKAINLLIKKTMRFEYTLKFKMINQSNILPIINIIS